jgi:DNA-binding LacI/PurR family transcriptional regulator
VILNHSTPGINASVVTIDSTKVGRQIGNAVLERSYKRITIISSDAHSQVLSGISDALTETVSQAPETEIISQLTGVHGYEAGVQTIIDLWAEDVKPDVIVCTSDYTALGILAGCRHKLGIKVPEELCIIGLGDIPVSGWKDHDLSTVKIPHDELVKTTVTTLISKIETQSMEPENIKLDAKLILRGTIKNL